MSDDLEKRIRRNEDELNALQGRVAEHEHRLDDGKQQISANANSISQLIAVVQGVMGRRGLVMEADSIADRVKAIEDWKSNMRGFIAGAAFIGGIVGSIIGAAALWLLNFLTKT
jgi:chromosome segregation ATPase